MILVRNLRLTPEQPLDALRGPAAKKLRIPEREIKELKLVKRSLDARKKSDIHYVCAVAAALHGDDVAAVAVQIKDVRVQMADVQFHYSQNLPPPASADSLSRTVSMDV